MAQNKVRCFKEQGLTPIMRVYDGSKIKASEQGFTLMELLLVVVIISILLAVAIPFFTPFIKQAQVTAAQNDFMNALNFARAQAITTQKNVIVCPKILNNKTCKTGAFNDWAKGWLIFQDLNGDNQFDTADSEVMLHVNEALDDDIVLYLPFSTPIIFNAAGMTNLQAVQKAIVCDHSGISQDYKGLAIPVTGVPYKVDVGPSESLACLGGA